jgi:precorrin-6B methylase 2
MSDENPLDGFWMEGDSLAPPCQAEMDVIDVLLLLAAPHPNTFLFDLGCGDGRICIEASRKFGCKSCGVEIEEKLYNEFIKLITEHNLNEKVTAILGDLQEVNLDDATVIVLYLLPEAIELIKQKLHDAVSRGCLLICNTWGPKGWTFRERVLCGPYNNVFVFSYDRNSLP